MKNLDSRTKYFFLNLTYYFLVIGVLIFSFSTGWGTEEPREFNLIGGILITGIIAIIVLGFNIALDFTNTAYPIKED